MGSVDYTMTRYSSINGYVGFIKGGDVVQRTFAGDRLTFAQWQSSRSNLAPTGIQQASRRTS